MLLAAAHEVFPQTFAPSFPPSLPNHSLYTFYYGIHGIHVIHGNTVWCSRDKKKKPTQRRNYILMITVVEAGLVQIQIYNVHFKHAIF
jgi:hypothetical protein